MLNEISQRMTNTIMIPLIRGTQSRQTHRVQKVEWWLAEPGEMRNGELFNGYRVSILQDFKAFWRLVAQHYEYT